MFVVWILTWILTTLNPPVPEAVSLWHWFGSHELLTIILIVLVA